MFQHLDAPATKLVNIRCALCGIPLVEAQSIASGVGPDCREKLGMLESLSRDVRSEVNQLMHRIAKLQRGTEVVLGIKRLKELGLLVAAERIEKRLGSRKEKLIAKERVFLSYERSGHILVMKAPKPSGARQAWVTGLRDVPGRRWDRMRQVNTFPTSSRKAVHALLLRFFKGHEAEGYKGTFIIGVTI